MKKLLFASAAAITMAASPAMAQHADAPLGSTNSVVDKRAFSPEQQAIYNDLSPDYRTEFDRLTPDSQTLYFGWDAALRDYYWTLDPAQKAAWWTLSEPRRIALFQREVAWSDVIGNGETPAADTPAVVAYTSGPAQMEFRSSPMVQNVDTTRPATYPLCQSDADDSCMNKWAAGLRGPGVDRPLSYYPEDETRKGG